MDTFQRTRTLENEVAPALVEGAQYSLPFCLGLAAVKGASALLRMSAADLHDERVLAVARRVTWSVDPEFDAAFPAAVPGRVTVTSDAGTHTQTVESPKGDWANPLTRAEVEAKLREVARDRLTPAATSRLLDAVAALDAGGIEPLRAWLRWS